MYKQNNDWDNKIYKGPFAVQKINIGAEYVYEHRYVTLKDLTMPSKKERFDEFKKLYNDYKKKKEYTMIFDLEDEISNIKEFEYFKQEYSSIDLYNLKTNKDYKIAYEIFNRLMTRSYGYQSSEEYSKRISDKWDAMPDDNDRTNYNLAQSPLIIFRANEVLKKASAENQLSAQEILDNFYLVKEKMNSKGLPMLF